MLSHAVSGSVRGFSQCWESIPVSISAPGAGAAAAPPAAFLHGSLLSCLECHGTGMLLSQNWDKSFLQGWRD